MKAIQLEFFVGRNKRHLNQPLWEWMVRAACAQGLTGATVLMGSLGFGHHRRIGPPDFFQLADQPVLILMILSQEEADTYLAMLKSEGIRGVFHVTTSVDCATLGDAEDATTSALG